MIAVKHGVSSCELRVWHFEIFLTLRVHYITTSIFCQLKIKGINKIFSASCAVSTEFAAIPEVAVLAASAFLVQFAAKQTYNADDGFSGSEQPSCIHPVKGELPCD